MRELRIGLLGCGTVGSGFVHLLDRDRRRIGDRYGVDVRVAKILVRDPAKCRAGVDPSLLTSSAVEVIDGRCDVVVEVMGGVHSAGAFVRRALSLGRDVVTANKALLAEKGRELFAAAEDRRLFLRFEASVCAGVPIVRALQSGLAGDTIDSVAGVLNGTCNFILTRMEQGLSLAEAATEAQRSGFAEEDLSTDIDGIDAAHKIAILAQLAFSERVRKTSVLGIRHLTSEEVVRAKNAGQAIRLIAEASRVPGGVEIRVEPRTIARSDPFVTSYESNVVIIRGRSVGEVLLAGKGAGAMPTAAAVLSDVLEIARLRAGGGA